MLDAMHDDDVSILPPQFIRRDLSEQMLQRPRFANVLPDAVVSAWAPLSCRLELTAIDHSDHALIRHGRQHDGKCLCRAFV